MPKSIELYDDENLHAVLSDNGRIVAIYDKNLDRSFHIGRGAFIKIHSRLRVLAPEHGRARKGSAHGRAKLTEDDVREIRGQYALGGWTQKDLAAQFGVNPSRIGAIVRRAAWRHVDA